MKINFFIKNIIKNIITINDILRWVISEFNHSKIYYGHTTNNSTDEALQLILPILFLPIDYPKNLFNNKLTIKEKIKIFKIIKKRTEKKIPTPYLTNKVWFCNLEFYINNKVIIPKSPIAEIINNKFYNLFKKKPNYILDMCTGCGCIAIACAYIFPNTEIDAVDINISALKLTEYNIYKHKIINKINTIYSNLFNNLPLLKYDMIITNPPYVNKKDIKNLPSEYKKEPKFSLITKNKNISIIIQILSLSLKYLSKNGFLICEVGNNKVKLTKKYPETKFKWIKFKNGGNGVFILTKKQLITHNKLYKILN